jgi:hypothetical protein
LFAKNLAQRKSLPRTQRGAGVGSRQDNVSFLIAKRRIQNYSAFCILHSAFFINQTIEKIMNGKLKNCPIVRK